MRWLENRIPPPIILVLALLGMGGVSRAWPEWRFSAPSSLGVAPLALGVALIVAGLALIMAGASAFRLASTTISPLHPEKATALVTRGVYGITRNPMYLAMALILMGAAVLLSNPLCLAPLLVFVILIDRLQIAPEERALTELFGEEYRLYRARVRRWI